MARARIPGDTASLFVTTEEFAYETKDPAGSVKFPSETW